MAPRVRSEVAAVRVTIVVFHVRLFHESPVTATFESSWERPYIKKRMDGSSISSCQNHRIGED